MLILKWVPDKEDEWSDYICMKKKELCEIDDVVQFFADFLLAKSYAKETVVSGFDGWAFQNKPEEEEAADELDEETK